MEKNFADHSNDKHISTSKFDKLTAENFATRLAQADLVAKTDFDNKLIDYRKKRTQTKEKI